MKNKIKFLSFYLPPEVMIEHLKKDKWPQVQTANFLKRLVSAMVSESSCYDFEFISVAPVTDYPNHKKVRFRKSSYLEYKNGKSISIAEVAFINIPILKIISRTLSFLLLSLKGKRSEQSAVICFSIHIPIIFAGWVSAKWHKVPLIGIWTDPPNVTNKFDSRLKSYLRGLESRLVKLLMYRCDSVIALTPSLVEEFARPNINSMIINGFAPDKVSFPKEKESGPIKIGHVGSLMERYGIKLFVDAFDELNCDGVELHIYGVGDAVSYIKEKSIRNQNIKYFGFLESHKVESTIRNFDYLINTRDPKSELVKYSFPSKVVEYLSSGVPMISTVLPTFEQSIIDSIIPVKYYSKESIKDAIKKCLVLDSSEYFTLSKNGIRAVKKYSIINQKKRLNSFLISECICCTGKKEK